METVEKGCIMQDTLPVHKVDRGFPERVPIMGR